MKKRSPEDQKKLDQWTMKGTFTGAVVAIGWWLLSRGKGDMSDAPAFFIIFGGLPALFIGGLLGTAVGSIWIRYARSTEAPRVD